MNRTNYEPQEMLERIEGFIPRCDAVTNGVLRAAADTIEALKADLELAKRSIHPGEAHATTVMRLQAEVERLRQDLHAVCSMDAFYADNGNDETVLVVPVADVREVLHGPS